MAQSQSQPEPHWLSLYASSHQAWSATTNANGKTVFTRPLGMVESSFDVDGIYYGGRADMTATLTLHITHRLTPSALRQRIVSAWTALTLHYVLLRSRVVEGSDDRPGRRFAVEVPGSSEEAIAATGEEVVFLSDFYGEEGQVDEEDLHHHALNVTRIIDPSKCLSRLHVLPLQRLDGDENGETFSLRFLIIIAHQISDGLSAYHCFRHFLQILNSSADEISTSIRTNIPREQIGAKLPPTQESLYPLIPGSKARQRWLWAILRVLRYVQKPLAPTFPNPLYAHPSNPHRQDSSSLSLSRLPHSYSEIFSYSPSTRPPMASGHIAVTLSTQASARLMALCKSSHVSIGAGCFALAGLSMMELYTPSSTTTTTSASPPPPPPAFAASFPLNPRAFFPRPPPPNSCMLTFSDGILMPYLPPSLPLEPRFRMTARHANRQLSAYQKRLKDVGRASKETGKKIGFMDPHSPIRHLATSYLSQLERVASKLPTSLQHAHPPSHLHPQGSLIPHKGLYGATCGVSSVGSIAVYLKPGVYALQTSGEKDFAADYRGLKMGVRARPGEFLVGSSTDAEGRVGFGVSYDADAISRDMAERWAETIRGLMEVGGGLKL